jgi:hypothetical protein
MIQAFRYTIVSQTRRLTAIVTGLTLAALTG